MQKLNVPAGGMQGEFQYPDTVIDALQVTLSSERLAPYLARADGDKSGAIKLHVRNTELSEAFYTPLQGLEITLRNAMDRLMAWHHGDEWYEPYCAPLQHPLLEMISTAKASLRNNKKEITRGRIVAELNFGFWTGMLGPRYENNLWRPILRHAFPYRPRRVERKQVQKALNSIRRLRNRVAHHEPILHRDLKADHALIISLISWMCPSAADWVEAHSRVADVLG